MGRLTDQDNLLLNAASEGDVEQARRALALGARLECFSPDDGVTPLMLAAGAGAAGLVEEFLARGARADAWIDEGLEQSAPWCGPTARPIFFVAQAGCKESYKLLDAAWRPDVETFEELLSCADPDMALWIARWQAFGREREALENVAGAGPEGKRPRL